MKILITGLISVSVLVLFACSQFENQQGWKIKNSSSNDIVVEFSHISFSNIKIDTIGPGEEKLVCYVEGMQGGENLKDPTLATDILIFNQTDTLVKDENLKSNWIINLEEIDDRNNIMNCEYKFSVVNSDF